MIQLLNYPIYFRNSLTTEYERVLTVFLDDVLSTFIKQFLLINNMVLELLLCHVCTRCNTNEPTSIHTTEQILDPMNHTGFRESRLNKDKNVLITQILVFPSV